MTISIDEVKKLRDKTGVSIMQCKKALEEAEGDMEKALINLTKKSGEIAAKKGDREFGAGVIAIAKSENKAVIIELACETDFVANNEEFRGIAKSIAELILAESITDSKDERVTAHTNAAVQKFGERTEVARFHALEGMVGAYVHSNNAVGAVVAASGVSDEAVLKQLAMHVSAQNPKYLTRLDITADEMEKAQEVLREEVADKPADMQDKILEGKVTAYFKERVLLDQSFIIDPSMSVQQVLGSGTITGFVRFGVGEE